MPEFQVSKEIELRPFTEENANEIFASVTRNFEHLRPFLHWVTPDYSLEGVKEFIAQASKASAERKSESYGIFYNHKLVGSIGFVNFNWNSKRMEIGYWIEKDFEGKGIVTKSCKALIDYAFDELLMNRIEIHCATENIRSRAIPERLGFQLEGVLRQSEWRHTRFYDMAIYGILTTEWREKSKK
jgi:ribosomal-protein-serine acetyltransferase